VPNKARPACERPRDGERAVSRERPVSFAASEEAMRTIRYVEPLTDASTPRADFFSILLEKRTPL
jgi:hypothetical protein